MLIGWNLNKLSFQIKTVTNIFINIKDDFEYVIYAVLQAQREYRLIAVLSS